MSQGANSPPSQAVPPRKHGLLYNVLWGWPWWLIGMFLASLLMSLMIEFVGMAFFWPASGVSHSEGVMYTELGYLSSEFTRSLLLSRPAVTVILWTGRCWQWMIIDSGLPDYVHRMSELHDTRHSTLFSALSLWLAGMLRTYLMATAYVTVTVIIRVTILLLSVPLFILVVLVALTEGLGRRDIRRYGAGYESSFVYHHAKKAVKPAIYIPCMLYLSWPTAIYPNLFMLPAAILLGIAVTVTTASFKKYI